MCWYQSKCLSSPQMSWSDKIATKKIRVDATGRVGVMWGVTSPFDQRSTSSTWHLDHHLFVLLDTLLLDICHLHEELTAQHIRHHDRIIQVVNLTLNSMHQARRSYTWPECLYHGHHQPSPSLDPATRHKHFQVHSLGDKLLYQGQFITGDSGLDATRSIMYIRVAEQ